MLRLAKVQRGAPKLRFHPGITVEAAIMRRCGVLNIRARAKRRIPNA